MKKIYIIFCLAVMPFCAAVAQEPEQTETSDFYQIDRTQVIKDPNMLVKIDPQPIPDLPEEEGGVVSINAGYIEDINWKTVLDFTDPALRPAPVVLPFFQDFPLENVEIKFRILNTKF